MTTLSHTTWLQLSLEDEIPSWWYDTMHNKSSICRLQTNWFWRNLCPGWIPHCLSVSHLPGLKSLHWPYSPGFGQCFAQSHGRWQWNQYDLTWTLTVTPESPCDHRSTEGSTLQSQSRTMTLEQWYEHSLALSWCQTLRGWPHPESRSRSYSDGFVHWWNIMILP